MCDRGCNWPTTTLGLRPEGNGDIATLRQKSTTLIPEQRHLARPGRQLIRAPAAASAANTACPFCVSWPLPAVSSADASAPPNLSLREVCPARGGREREAVPLFAAVAILLPATVAW